TASDIAIVIPALIGSAHDERVAVEVEYRPAKKTAHARLEKAASKRRIVAFAVDHIPSVRYIAECLDPCCTEQVGLPVSEYCDARLRNDDPQRGRRYSRHLSEVVMGRRADDIDILARFTGWPHSSPR